MQVCQIIMANNCKHIKCGACGGIKLKKAYVGATLNEVCNSKCLVATKDACECKCQGKFHQGNNAKILNEILKPKAKKVAVKKTKKVAVKKVAAKKIVKKAKKKVLYFEPETIKDEVALFIQGKRFKTSSFDRYSDPNYRKDAKTLALNWLSKNGQALDVAALDFLNLTNYTYDENYIIDLITEIIIQYPSGIKQYIVDAIDDKKNREEAENELMYQNYYSSNFDNYNEDDNYKTNTLRFQLNGIKNMKLKKGSAAAKAFMAKIRAKKGKVIAKKLISGTTRKTQDVYYVYGYYPTGKELVYTATTRKEALNVIKDYRSNERNIRFTMASGREKISGFKKGNTRFIEKGEKPFKTLKTVQVKRRITTKPKGTFKKFTTISGIKKDLIMKPIMKFKVGSLPAYKDPYAAREIQLYADNDSQLYFSRMVPILINLSKKHKKGIYDVKKSAKLFRYFIEAAMQKYNKDFGSRGDSWSKLLSVSDRNILANDYAINALIEFEAGNYTEK